MASRFRQLRREELNEEQLAAWEAVRQTWGSQTSDGSEELSGPFSVVVHAPELVPRLLELGKTLRSPASLPPQTVELIILIIGAHWRADFEWWMHVDRARQSGIDESIINAIAKGQRPEFEDELNDAVYGVVQQLLASGGLDDATYAAARGMLGERGLVEVVSLCGYYTLIAFILNAFEVPLPPGAGRLWPSARE